MSAVVRLCAACSAEDNGHPHVSPFVARQGETVCKGCAFTIDQSALADFRADFKAAFERIGGDARDIKDDFTREAFESGEQPDESANTFYAKSIQR